MNTNAAHPRGWQVFEVVFGIPFLIAILLQFAVPVSFPNGSPRLLLVLGGAALIVTGVTFVVLARGELAHYAQPTGPGLPTRKLVTTGVFSLSRNPLYLGGACALAGIGLAANSPWVILLLVPALVGCHFILIAPEERYLAAKFSGEYAAYTASVHRWLGRK